MANVLDNILEGVGKFSRSYQLGPYADENQKIKRQTAQSRLESEGARKAYWESRGGATGNKQQSGIEAANKALAAVTAARTNAMDEQTIADLDGVIRQITSYISANYPSVQGPSPAPEPAVSEKGPGLLSRIGTWMKPTSDPVGTRDQPGLPATPRGTSLPPGGTPVGFGSGIMTGSLTPSTAPRPGGALNNIVGPPLPVGLNRYAPPGVQSKWTASTPQQRTEMFTPPPPSRTVASTALTAPPGLDEIWGELDAESRKAALQFLQQGATPQQLIAHYRKRAGK